MTANWTMEAKSADQRRVSLHFYSGPSARPSSDARLEGKVDGKGSKRSKFSSQVTADGWAAALGVEYWDLTQHSRAFPEAASVPIRFPHAPDNNRLQELIAAFEAGTPLAELAASTTVQMHGETFPVHPNLLRLWLIGAAPRHPALQRLKRDR
jgi:hypothetical protein